MQTSRRHCLSLEYLIGRDGRLKAAFASAVEPTDPRVIVAIETELSE